MQGVSFRANACDQATRLKVRGWVRNLPNGDVEALAEGPSVAVDQFVQWCQHGPPEAAVESVTQADERVTGEFSSFEVLR